MKCLAKFIIYIHIFPQRCNLLTHKRPYEIKIESVKLQTINFIDLFSMNNIIDLVFCSICCKSIYDAILASIVSFSYRAIDLVTPVHTDLIHLNTLDESSQVLYPKIIHLRTLSFIWSYLIY